jgi:hypothetical protein
MALRAKRIGVKAQPCSTGDGAFDQAAVAQEIFDGGEPIDVADLVENGQSKILTDSRDRLQQRVIATGDGFSDLLKLQLQ